MNNTIRNIFIFAAGIGVGSISTLYLVKSHYEEEKRKEIEDIRDFYRNRQGSPSTSDTDDRDETESYVNKEIKNDYSKVLTQEKYKEEKPIVVDKEKALDEEFTPYVISEDDFGEMIGYDAINLVYFADDILVDDNEDPVEDITNLIGDEALLIFRDCPEVDTVYVRNNSLEIDYEIERDTRNFADVSRKPHIFEE